MPSYARVPTLAAMFLKVLESSFLKGKVPCKAPHSMALAPGTHDKSVVLRTAERAQGFRPRSWEQGGPMLGPSPRMSEMPIPSWSSVPGLNVGRWPGILVPDSHRFSLGVFGLKVQGLRLLSRNAGA